MRLHPYYTQRILAQPPAFAEWGALAAAHRERLDGSGYHRNILASMLTPAMRMSADRRGRRHAVSVLGVRGGLIAPAITRPLTTFLWAALSLCIHLRFRQLEGGILVSPFVHHFERVFEAALR
jgi:hypothetical protein